MRNLSEEYYWFLTGVVALLLVALGGAIYMFNDNTQENEMKACVAAGKDWVRDGITSYYECKEVQ